MSKNPEKWNAQWIAGMSFGGPSTTAPASYLRSSFHLPSSPKQAWLHVTALGLYECEINGMKVGDHVFAPGWTDYHKRVFFQTYDVSNILNSGENAWGVILGDGWYCGSIADKGRQLYGERPQFLAQLQIELENGTEIELGSDSSWKTTTGPILESDFLGGESYDARRELGAWSSPGYNDSRWQPVEPAVDPKILIERSPAPPVRRIEYLPARLLTEALDSTRCVFDFGQNFSGRIRFSVRGRRGVHLKIRHGEVLDATGQLYTHNLREAKATDYYTLRGDGIEQWEPRFTFHGFRYAEVSWEGQPDEVTLNEIGGVVLHSDMALTGYFQCSSPLLNQLEKNILWGQKSNFLEVPTDCPQRNERLGWTGDAQVFIRTAAFHMDVRGFFHKWLQDLRDAQSPNGAVPSVIPETHSFGLPEDGGPGWADAVFICPWTIYLCYGDLEILQEQYDSMAAYLNYLAKHKVKEGIRAHPDVDSWGGFGDWLALDGSGKNEGGTPRDLIGTAFYARDLEIMADTAKLLGKTEDALRYGELHSQVVSAFRRRYVSTEGCVAGGTQTAYVLALHFRLIEEGACAQAARELVRLIRQNGMHLATGFLGTPYLLHVLEAHGHLDVAYALLEQETFPSWLFPVKNGATTIWERWDGWTAEKGFQNAEMNSFNHYAYGAVGDWMISTVAGLEIQEAGYRKIRFKPRPGGTISWAEARLLTPHGETAIRWEVVGEEMRVDITVPPGCEAAFDAPADFVFNVHTIKAGRHAFNGTSVSL